MLKLQTQVFQWQKPAFSPPILMHLLISIRAFSLTSFALFAIHAHCSPRPSYGLQSQSILLEYLLCSFLFILALIPFSLFQKAAKHSTIRSLCFGSLPQKVYSEHFFSHFLTQDFSLPLRVTPWHFFPLALVLPHLSDYSLMHLISDVSCC